MKIEFNHAEHNGGTKSYQVWRISGPNGWFVIHQWGKIGACTAGRGIGGQSKHMAYANEHEAAADTRSIMRAKAGRGYGFKNTWSKHVAASGREREALVSLFGSSMADTILAHVGVGAAAAVPAEVFEATSIDNADWGTW